MGCSINSGPFLVERCLWDVSGSCRVHASEAMPHRQAMNRACSPVRQATVSPLAWGGPHAVGVVPFAVPVSWMVGSEPDRDDDSTSYATEESEEPWFSLPPCSKSKSKSSCCL